MDVRALAARVDTREGEEALRAASVDSGRILVRMPRAVAAPRTPRDVLEIVRWANRTGSRVALRGTGHTQAGQSLTGGGVQVDMQGLDRVGPLDEARQTLQVEAGATWREAVGYARRRGWMPMVLTNNLDTTVGGTLSTGGVGQSSHLHGTQANNVDALEAVTGDGRLLRCSRDRERLPVRRDPGPDWASSRSSPGRGSASAACCRACGPSVSPTTTSRP